MQTTGWRDEVVSRGRPAVILLAGVVLCGAVLACGGVWARTQAVRRPQSVATPGGPGQLTLAVKESLGVARVHWPVTAGVPFPQGSVRDVSAVRLIDEHAALPVQARVLSRWPDGSARWVLLDWQVDLRAGQVRQFTVEPASGGAAPVTRAPGAVKLRDAGDHLEVDTGPLQFAISKTRFAIIEHVRLNGVPVTAGPMVSFFNVDGKRIDAQPPREVKITEAGPWRARIELRGHYGSGFDYVVRVEAFANQPCVRVLHSFEQHSPEPYIFVRQIGIDLPLTLAGKAIYSAGVENDAPLSGEVPPGGFTLVQEDNEAFRVGASDTRRPGHAAGWADLHDATRGVAVIGRYFWQEYPQGFELRPTGMTYNLWAPGPPPAKVGMGAAKTHEMLLCFHDTHVPPATTLAALAQPLLARINPQWIVATQALRNSISAAAATSPFLRELGAAYQRTQANADVERWDDRGQVRCPAAGAADAGHAAAVERPRRGFYGMFNWGDWNFHGYHDTTKGCDAWGNLEYDMTQVLALAYAATGEPAYFDGMVAAARHFTDVDHIYYAGDRPGLVGMNHPKNPLHFTFELGGVDLGHTWTEGLLSYYYLTGDTRSLDAALGIADYLVQRLRASVLLISNPRQFGWPQIALVAAYEASGDLRYKAAAIDYARRGMRAHPADRLVGKNGAADWKMGVLAEGIAYTYSISSDPEMRAWLLRYAAAVRARGDAVDPRYLPAVAYVGRLAHQAEYTRAATAAAEHLRFGNWAKPFTIAGRLGFSLLSQPLQSQ